VKTPDVGTNPLVSVSIYLPRMVPEHELPAYMVYVTIFPALEVAPISVAVSVTDPPAVIVVAES
jgi:hypothetical protein